jgi:hypothetical protein
VRRIASLLATRSRLKPSDSPGAPGFAAKYGRLQQRTNIGTRLNQMPNGENMTTPPYFDAYTPAIETYPDDNVKLHMVDLAFRGSVLNASETATFNVKVTNNGPVMSLPITAPR